MSDELGRGILALTGSDRLPPLGVDASTFSPDLPEARFPGKEWTRIEAASTVWTSAAFGRCLPQLGVIASCSRIG